jgi:hypothetical protein
VRRLGIATVPHVHVSLDHEIRVTRHAGGRTLVVGGPLAFALGERALRVVVAHALLRDSRWTTRMLEGWACRVLNRTHALAFLRLSRPWRAVAERIWLHVAGATRARVLLDDASTSARLGARAAAAALRAGARGAVFATYWQEEVAPCLEAGYRPPVLAGWRRFRQDAAIAEHVNATIAADLDAVAARDDPMPSLGERLAAAEAAGGRANDLADDPPFAPQTPATMLEAAALRATGGSAGSVLVELAWERAADVVWRPRLLADVVAHRDALEGRTVADLAQLAATAGAGDGDGGSGGISLDTLGAALAIALAGRGWELVAGPPGPLRAVSDDHELGVLGIPAFLAMADELDEWHELLAHGQLEDLSLAAPANIEPAVGANVALAWPTLTVPAALALRRTPHLRRVTAAGLAIAGPLGLGLCGLMAALAVTAANGRQALFFGISAPLATAAMLWWLGKRARIAFTRGSLSITNSDLTIEDRGLLREPLVIDRAHVRAVSIDEGKTRGAIGQPLRFAFGPSSWRHPSTPANAASGWLWSGPHDASVRLLGVGDEVPNLLLLFDEPLPGPSMRLRGNGLPHDREDLAALALSVRDATAAEHAFAGWGVLRPLSDEDGRLDFGPVFARRQEQAVQRRALRRGWLLVACGLIVPPAALAALVDATKLPRRRASVLVVAALAVVAVRSALYFGWG